MLGNHVIIHDPFFMIVVYAMGGTATDAGYYDADQTPIAS